MPPIAVGSLAVGEGFSKARPARPAGPITGVGPKKSQANRNSWRIKSIDACDATPSSTDVMVEI